jgi:hypothetical protein
MLSNTEIDFIEASRGITLKSFLIALKKIKEREQGFADTTNCFCSKGKRVKYSLLFYKWYDEK